MSALDWCCIDDCRNRSVVIIRSFPDDTGLCEEHRSVAYPLESWETEERVRAVPVVDAEQKDATR